MTKETKFLVELAKLLDKHDVALSIVHLATEEFELEFHIENTSCSNFIHSNFAENDITHNEVLNNLIGKTATAEHPITCANPDLEFIITDVKLDRGILFVRGENTMWFGESMINIK